MFNKSIIFAALAASFAAPVLADTAARSVNPGVAMQAKILGVDPTQFTASELALLDLARQEGDSITEQAILNKAIRSGFESNYFVDGTKLSSSDN